MQGRIAVILAISLAAATAKADEKDSITQRLKYYLAQEEKAPPAIKKILKKLRSELKRNRKRFDVGFTAVSHLKLEDITGFIPLDDWKKSAKKQNNIANELKEKYENRLKKLEVVAPITPSNLPEHSSESEPILRDDENLKNKLLRKWKSITGQDDLKSKEKVKVEEPEEVKITPTPNKPSAREFKLGCNPDASSFSFNTGAGSSASLGPSAVRRRPASANGSRSVS